MNVRTKQGVLLGGLISVFTLAVFVFALDTQTTAPPARYPVSGNAAGNDYSDATVTANDDTTNGVAFNSTFFGSSLANAPTVINAPIQGEKTFQSSLRVVPRTKGATYPADAAVVIDGETFPLRTYTTALTPNDPLPVQWWASATKLPAAWDITTGSSNVTIAIIDTGFALSHEEFNGRWYENSGEVGSVASEAVSTLNCTDRGLPLNQNCNLVDDNLDQIVDNETGSTTYENPSRRNCTDRGLPLDKRCNNIDDDSNGFVDDVTGWDFVNQDASVQAGQLNPSGDGTTHGTMVAGVAAATGNNGRGIAGVNWGAKILPIQAIDDDSYGDTVTVGNAIRYAVRQGAKVINLSLGTPLQDTYVRLAVEEATKAGAVVVAASGNDGCNCVSYPAAYPEVLAVGALNTDGTRASFSSYGGSLDVMAPGVSITTTTWTSTNGQSAYASGVAGTSFASPLVAGIIASMRSLQNTAVPLQIIGGLGESTLRPTQMAQRGQDSFYGFGQVDAQKSYNRLTNSLNGVMTYGFSPVYAGTAFGSPASDVINASVGPRYCDTAVGTTPVYELRKTGAKLFTISPTEMRRAQSQGYAASLFAYTCVSQPHDMFQLLRSIDINKEFYNDYTRYN